MAFDSLISLQMVETVCDTILNHSNSNVHNNNIDSYDDDVIDFGYEREDQDKDEDDTASVTSSSSSKTDAVEFDNEFLQDSSTSAFGSRAHEVTTESDQCTPEIDASVFRRQSYKWAAKFLRWLLCNWLNSYCIRWRTDYDADIAKFSTEFGIFGNAIDGLYAMLKSWRIFEGVSLAGSERNLKLLEKKCHAVSEVIET